MSNIQKAILIIGLAAIVYYGYVQLADFKKSIEDKLDFL